MRKPNLANERKFKFVLEYDGTDFSGWQKQSGARTIQAVIEDAVSRVAGSEAAVYGAGRTDAGVHALGQVCHFSCRTLLSPEDFARAVSVQLPPDIYVRHASEVPLDFHARFDATGRRYCYYVRTSPTALWRRYFQVIPFDPDIAVMRKAAAHLIGEKDFEVFTAAGTGKISTTCRLDRVHMRKAGVVISFEFEANRFLRKMVRTIVGTLLEVGRRKITPEQMGVIISRKDRRAAGPTLPPHGLFLVEVIYAR